MSDSSARCWAVLPAAGIGSRMASDIPKQYLQVAGRSILAHSLASLLACEMIESVVVALHPDDTRASAIALLDEPRVQRVTGGDERSDSVLAGLDQLAQCAAENDWVLVHDAARPCLHRDDIARLIARVTGSGTGGILAEPVVETVKLATEDGLVSRTMDRSRLWRAQTPQMFKLTELRSALLAARQRGLAVTDEASAMEMAGYPVQLVAGSPSNLKVTVPDDLTLAGFYLGRAATGGGEVCV